MFVYISCVCLFACLFVRLSVRLFAPRFTENATTPFELWSTCCPQNSCAHMCVRVCIFFFSFHFFLVPLSFPLSVDRVLEQIVAMRTYTVDRHCGRKHQRHMLKSDLMEILSSKCLYTYFEASLLRRVVNKISWDVWHVTVRLDKSTQFAYKHERVRLPAVPYYVSAQHSSK